jgi:hypothetical protein
MNAQLNRDIAVGSTGTAGENDPTPQRQRLRRRLPTSPAPQRLGLLDTQFNLDRWSTLLHHHSRSIAVDPMSTNENAAPKRENSKTDQICYEST